MDSPLRFLIRFFSNFLQAYILPVARTCEIKYEIQFKFCKNIFEKFNADGNQKKNENEKEICCSYVQSDFI